MRMVDDAALADAAERLERQKSGVKRPPRSIRKRRIKEKREVQLAEEEEDSEQKGV